MVSNARRSIFSIPSELSHLFYSGLYVVRSDTGLSMTGRTKLVARILWARIKIALWGRGLGRTVATGDAHGRLGFRPLAVLFLFVIACLLGGGSWSVAATVGVHEGVASCGGSTCHSRPVADGPVVRQNELVTWQDSYGPAGAHSRAWRVLTEPRAQAIAQRLGLGPAQKARECLGCHSDAAPAGLRGERFQTSDGVGCESCHGGSGGWLASHYAVGATHAGNIAAGMTALDDPKVRAELCLDCHFGSAKDGQFVSHQLMSAGHPRLAFELDLFTELQRHHTVDADYVARGKIVAGGVKTWALGQTFALQRALTLFSDARFGQNGAFPEFYFFDCRSCHRAFSDASSARPSAVANPGRSIPSGTPPFNDENMILLSAAARAAAPQLAARLESDSVAFHAALAKDRPGAVRAAGALAADARTLESAFRGRAFSRAETLAILSQVLSDASGARYTDYQGGAQAVMAVDTLLSAIAAGSASDHAAVAAIRPDIDRAYQAVQDANTYSQADLRKALARIAVAAEGMR